MRVVHQYPPYTAFCSGTRAQGRFDKGAQPTLEASTLTIFWLYKQTHDTALEEWQPHGCRVHNSTTIIYSPVFWLVNITRTTKLFFLGGGEGGVVLVIALVVLFNWRDTVLLRWCLSLYYHFSVWRNWSKYLFPLKFTFTTTSTETSASDEDFEFTQVRFGHLSTCFFHSLNRTSLLYSA